MSRVDYFALGGTIASLSDGGDGAVPTMTAGQLAQAIPGLDAVATVHPHQFLLAPSSEITVTDLVNLVTAMREAVEEGAGGLVVSQGTDSLEETAFALDLLWERAEPVVVTGAMRNPSLAGADGPANLLSAIRVAASCEASGAGVLVCLNDEIHAARWVRKTHTSSPSTFQSPGLGPLGWVSEGRPVLVFRPIRNEHVTIRSGATIPSVALVKVGLADDGRLLGAVLDLGFDAVVIEGLGGGHVPAAMLPAIDRLVARIPVVLASRAGAGEVLSSTYRFPGGEMDLLGRGVLRAGALDGPKSRMLVILALAAGCTNAALKDLLRSVGTPLGDIGG